MGGKRIIKGAWVGLAVACMIGITSRSFATCTPGPGAYAISHPPAGGPSTFYQYSGNIFVPVTLMPQEWPDSSSWAPNGEFSSFAYNLNGASP